MYLNNDTDRLNTQAGYPFLTRLASGEEAFLFLYTTRFFSGCSSRKQVSVFVFLTGCKLAVSPIHTAATKNRDNAPKQKAFQEDAQ